jgi:hypothetical protein
MNAFTPYIVNEHLARLMVEAEQACIARRVSDIRPPSTTRLARALRSLVVRRRASTEPAPA